jgi:hypothetical protein
VSLRRLQPTLPRDVETICLKCLAKEPHKRYVSGQALADDLRRFLDGEPVRARPVAAWERAAKWARRRPAVAALVATLAAVSVLAFATVTWAWLRAETNRVAAERSRGAAITAAEEAETARAAEQAERERVEQLLYAHDIALAHHEYLTHNLVRANQLLERCRPELRHWEWDYLDRLVHAESLVLPGLSLPVTSVAYSPDGKRIAASSGRMNWPEPGEVKVWDALSGRELFTFRAQSGPVQNLAFSPDGRRLGATCVRERSGVSVWDLQDGTEQLAIDAAGAMCLAFSRNVDAPARLAVGLADGRLKLFDGSSGQLLRSFDGHQGNVHSVAFHPDETRLASGCRDGTARIWDSNDGRELMAYRSLNDVRVVAFSPDGKQFLAATFDGAIKMWDIRTGTEIGRHQAGEH